MTHSGGSAADYDAVVIGAGHNGLVAANMLADGGWRVLVLEASPFIGGAIRSDESVAPGYVTDLYSSFYPLAAASPIIESLDLRRWGLQWTHAPSVLAHVWPDDRCAVLSRDLDETAMSLESFGTGDGAAWIDLVHEFERVRRPLIEALFRPFPPVTAAVQLLRALGVADALRFARFAVTPVRRFGDEQFTGEAGPLLLAGNALHTDLAPEGPGSALYGWLLCMLGQTVGFPVPVGGSGRLAAALADRARAAGAEVRLDAPVERVVTRLGRVTGVTLAGGEMITTGSVLADVPAPTLYRDLVGLWAFTDRFARDLERFEWDTPTMKVNWALSGPIPWTAAEARGAGTVHLGVDLNGLTFYAADLAAKAIPTNPFLLLGQMTTADSSRSPAGTESAWAYTHVPAGVPLSADDVARHVDLIESRIERNAPGFRSRIIGRTVQRPTDLQAADANLVSGAVGGGTSSMHQQLIFRPIPGLGGAETPIDGLYLASASAHPGGGVHGGPGANAARAALARGGITGAVRRRAVRLAMNRIYAD